VKKPLCFHEDALAEFAAQTGYYEAKSTGLGEKFTNEVEAATAIAREFPEMGAPFKYNTRRVFPKKFPFSIVYRILAQEIVFVAVAPDARKPGYWRSRKNDGEAADRPDLHGSSPTLGITNHRLTPHYIVHPRARMVPVH